MKNIKVYFTCVLFFLVNISMAQQGKSASEILLSLKKLQTSGSVLYVAAHPDDENTRLITWLANEKCVRTGYLSLTRGDGGQNLIGKEQGEYLGLIRTQELLGARKIDGGEQFFTRANDFGYSKNPQETFDIWNKDSVLKDVVWAIRKFRPDIVICRFGTDGSGGHGHHTASAILAEEAFDLAGDPAKYPEQLSYVKVWKPSLLLWNFWMNRAQIQGKTARIDVGGYNPILGKSYGEIAAESRSMHKSQGFGVAKSQGESHEYFKIIKGDCDSNNIFSGLDLYSNTAKPVLNFNKIITRAIREFDFNVPSGIIPTLLEAYKAADLLPDEHYKQQKKKDLERIIAECAGIYAEATAVQYVAVPGNKLRINYHIIKRSPANIVLDKVVFSTGEDSILNFTLNNNKSLTGNKTITIPPTQSYTNPYWLDKPLLSKGLFNVADQNMIGIPESAAGVHATFYLSINGAKIVMKLPVNYKWVEPSDGEKYRNLEVLTPVTANFEDKVFMFADNGPKMVKIILRSNSEKSSGLVKFSLPDGWTAYPAQVLFTISGIGNEQIVTTSVSKTSNASEGVVKAEVQIGSDTYTKSIIRISYPHIPNQTLLYEASSKIVPVDLRKKNIRIGYINGAGDDVAKCLAQVGYNISVLGDEQLAEGSISGYGAIVVGVRAYNTNERMKIYYAKLMDYVSQGGTLIVQYNTLNWISNLKSEIGPYKFNITRERVTKEDAPVIFDKPDHPILNSPNKITQRDFDGWIQERGIYFVDQKDLAQEYETIFSCNDPGEKPQKGSLIVAKYGKGWFIYTGLAFFRQLPAGVPGAYRLFGNLVELK